jgi:Calpain family cysteine protease
MSVSIDYKTKGWLSAPSQSRKITPGVSGEICKPIKTPDGVIPVGNAIIQPGENPNEFKITTYKKVDSKNPDLPESQRDIEPDKTYDVTLEEPSKYIQFNDEQYARTEQELFAENSVNIDAINQGRVPNCFFLAALAEILNHPNGDAYIRSIMRQNENGTTTVKLYTPDTLEPVYITVDNSYIIDKRGALSNHKQFWPMILEKAYLGLAEELEKNDVSMRSVYSGGGYRGTALTVLTGHKVKEKMLDFESSVAWDIKNYFKDQIGQIEPLMPLRETMQNFDLLAQELVREKQKPFKEIFGDTKTALEKGKELLLFYIEHKEQWDAIVTSTPPNLNELANLITTFSDNESICNSLNALKNYYYVAVDENQVRLDTPSYNGLYTPEQVKLFNKLKHDLAQGKLITAGTYTKEEYKEKGIDKLTGLRATHAYSVLNVIEKKVPVTGYSKMETMYFIQLRNPWGNTGRIDLPNIETGQYESIESHDAGVFNMPLEDFCKYFRSCSITDSVNDVFNLAAKKERLADKMLKVLTDWPESINSNHLDLIATYDSYARCEQLLIDIEAEQLESIDAKLLHDIYAIFADQKIDEPIKAMAVKGLIDEKLFPYVPGNEEEVKQYIYQLLLNKWHQEQGTLTPELLRAHKKNVFKHHENDELWQKLQTNYQVLRLTAMESAKENLPKILQVSDELIEKLSDLVDKIPQEQEQLRRLYLNTFFTNYEIMMNSVKAVYEYQALLKRLDIDIYDEEFATLEQKLEILSSCVLELKKSNDAKECHAQIKKEIPEISYGQLDNKAKENLAIKLDFLGIEAEKFIPANRQEQQQQQELIGFIAKIKSLFILLGNFFKKLFKSQSNSYEVEAKDELPFSNPAKTPFGLFVPVVNESNEELVSPRAIPVA